MVSQPHAVCAVLCHTNGRKLICLYMNCYNTTFYVGVAVLKKHYYILLRSFPSDHMITLGKICQLTFIDDGLVDRILSCSTSRQANRAILDIMIVMVKSDIELLDFCNALGGILGNMPAVLMPLRIGQ